MLVWRLARIGGCPVTIGNLVRHSAGVYIDDTPRSVPVSISSQHSPGSSRRTANLNLSPPIRAMDPSFGSPVSPLSDTPQSISKRPLPRGTAAYPRKRAVTACQVCRARRTKCDNKKPSCSFCERVGAKCISSSVDLSAFDPASLKILERLDHLEETLALQHSQLLQQK